MTSVQPIEFRRNCLRDAPVHLLGVQFLDALASQGNQGLQPVRAWCVPPWASLFGRPRTRPVALPADEALHHHPNLVGKPEAGISRSGGSLRGLVSALAASRVKFRLWHNSDPPRCPRYGRYQGKADLQQKPRKPLLD